MNAQILVLILFSIELFGTALMHGRDKGKYHFGVTLLAYVDWFFILRWGGVWEPLGW